MSSTIARGETFHERLTVLDRVTGVRIPLPDGILIFATMSPSPGQPSTLAKSVGDGITILDQTEDAPTVGQADIVWYSSDTAQLTEGVYWRDVWLVDLAGNETPVVEPLAIKVYEPVRRR
jgi:hypothetical protein